MRFVFDLHINLIFVFCTSIAAAVLLTLLGTMLVEPDNTTPSPIGAVSSDPGQFYQPRGVYMNSTDHIFVADTINSRIQIFNSTGHFVKIVGFPGNTGGDGSLYQPYDLALSTFDNLYVVNTFGNNIKVYDYTTGNHLATIGGPGDGNREFYYPSGIGFNGNATAAGAKYAIADTFNQRVQVFNGTDNSFLFEIPLP